MTIRWIAVASALAGWVLLAVPAGAEEAARPPSGSTAATPPALEPGHTPPPAGDPATPAAGAAGAASDAPAPDAAAPPAAPGVAPVARPEPLRLDPPRADAPRPTLLPLAQPLWSDLTPAQQQVLRPFESQWNGLPLSEKRAWADVARRFPQMKPDEQRRIERRVAEWAQLTPDQRRVARANYRLAQQAEREQLLAEWERYQSLTPEQQAVLRAAGATSNTAARHAGAVTGLAREAAQPLPRRAPPLPSGLTVGTPGGTSGGAGGVAPTSGAAPTPGAPAVPARP
jgi:hypothetical protein